jgi:hypothetical protein
MSLFFVFRFITLLIFSSLVISFLAAIFLVISSDNTMNMDQSSSLLLYTEMFSSSIAGTGRLAAS